MPRRLIIRCGLMCLLAAVWWAFDGHYRFFDMAIYQGAVRWWVEGGDLYSYQAPVRGRLGFTYPPFAAVVLLPTTLVPLRVAGLLITVLSLLALAAALWALADLLGLRHGRGRTAVPALIFGSTLATEPVRQNLGLGQVNLLLFALVVLDLVVLARAGSRWTGIGVGIATAIKLTPGLFIVYLLATRQWRAAATAGATAAALTVAMCLVAPRETMQYFGDLLWQTGRVGAADAVANQSLSGLLARLAESHTAPRLWWLALCAAAVIAGLRRAASAHARGDEVTALTVTGLVANLITPIAWTHHLVFLPVALVLLARTRRVYDTVAAAACYALSVLSPIWWVDDRSGGLTTFLAGNTFVLMTIFLVWRLPLRSRPFPDRWPGQETPRLSAAPPGRLTAPGPGSPGRGTRRPGSTR
jgi:alpha-1,2-mannosyltransferase